MDPQFAEEVHRGSLLLKFERHKRERQSVRMIRLVRSVENTPR